MDLGNVIASLVGAIVGGSITGYFTHRAVNKSHENDLLKQEKVMQESLKGLYQSIHDEIDTLWNIYLNGIGNQLEQLGENLPLEFLYPITQEYFTVYTSNAALIGQIPNPKLRKLIITTYTKARGLIDSYRLNNSLVENYRHALWTYTQTNNTLHKQLSDERYSVLVAYASKLTVAHHDIKKDVNDLLDCLKNIID
ncbi:MAG: hypothetical protein IID03_02965 [Candidatus Dadabacteria bacterium]|nr:hypothetical protein [Candidatus Dadabacteria bacterium]